MPRAGRSTSRPDLSIWRPASAVMGGIAYARALVLQNDLVERRKRGEIPDQLLIVEHPHVVTMGRNGHEENLLAAPELLERAGIEFPHTDRGGDVTYHGPARSSATPSSICANGSATWARMCARWNRF